MAPEPFRFRLLRFWPGGLIFLLWLVFFGPVISGYAVPGFRDSAYLYFPLFWWIDQQMAAGDLPLWNPYCGFGYPLVADGSSSVFYPGKVVFLLSWLGYPVRYGIFLAIHVLVAAGGCYWLARTMKAGPAGSTLAAMGYAFGGPVVFQVNNCPYLIGAAWLPFALVCTWNVVHHGRSGWVVAGGFFCALILLAGDPQTVYHIGLIGLATLFCGWLRKRRRYYRGNRHRLQKPHAWAVRSLFRLAGMGLIAGLLAAVQLLPSYLWSLESERSFFYSPRTLSEVVEYINWPEDQQRFDLTEAILGPPEQLGDTHLSHIYQFSQPPWSLGELVWPNFSGKMFPLNRRWTAYLPGADRVWSPSLYSGCFVFVLMLASCQLWGSHRRCIWLTRLGLFFAVGSLGWYGLVWLIQEALGGQQLGLGEQVGGLYWAMVTLLPEFVMFRYPAKLFVVASLAGCVLAGLGWSRMFGNRGCRRAYLFELVAGISGLMAVFATRPWEVLGLNVRVSNGSWFGPFLPDVAAGDLTVSFMTSLVALLLFRVIQLWARTGWRIQAQFLLLTLAAIEILVANHWLTAQVPCRAFAGFDSRVESVAGLTQPPVPGMPVAVEDRIPDESEWEKQTSPRRLSEIVEAQIRTKVPKFHLGGPARHFDSFASINSVYFQEYIYWARQLQFTNQELSGFAWVRQLRPVSVANHNRDLVFLALPRREAGYRSLNERVEVVRFENQRMEFRVEIPEDGWFIVRQQFAPGWRAVCYREGASRGESATVRRLGPFRAIRVKPGRQTIEMDYFPFEFYVGAVSSGFAWLILGGFALIGFLKMHNRRWRQSIQ